MKAEFMHIGIPVTNRKNGMVYELSLIHISEPTRH